MGFCGFLIKNGIVFGAGMYAGVYVAQNYQIDKVEDPKVLFNKVYDKIKEKVDEVKKDK
ncbi:uncharacterized protein LOC125227103 isoform X2 [Leguminivora glycinivorella]|uniref:uncharacterized protein LOC125227103 isoform X2 n=1 Tax=Leguminivora glycinivorella TaxID=1035111 RepID=UPI00200F0B7A|nr:uncharacterized protein LOC125227103 isoform X2 [Leguminivora glycinivorella]XP_047987268.1 uncharacterized protein LOC125227103 isoform X2 [Leguminivora glycinivorella]